MKLSRKRNLLLSFAGALLLGTGIGIGFGTGKTVNQNQIGFLSGKINSLNFELQQYNQANKVAKLKINNLKTQSEKLQLFVKDLNELNLSSENLDKLSSNISNPKASNDGYKAFEQPFSTWKTNLVNKISTLNTTLKNLSSNNDSLSGETQQGITTSLNKIKELLNSLEKIAFAFTDTNSVIKVFESIQKDQNTFLAQLTNIISLITIEISKHNQATNELNEEIAQRDEKIKELVKKLTNQLNFYLKLISRLRKNLKQFNKLNFEQVDKTTGEKIKTKINKTLKLLKSKETHFKQLLDQINQSLVDAKNDNDYSSVQSYDLNEVNKGFEKIVSEYDLIRSSVISLYEKNNQERGLQIVNLQNQNNALQSQIDTLNEQKNDLEQNIEQTKNDLMNNLALVLENQITTLSTIEQTIRDSSDANTDTSNDKLKSQIQALTNLKTQYTADNYSQTFIPVINSSLKVAQEFIQEYKINVLDTVKAQYQNTLESLNSTREQLNKTQSELNAKNQELSNTQNSLNNVRAELEQNKLTLATTQETLTATQSQLERLNTEITTNKAQAKVVFNTVKEIYDNLKNKAQEFLGSVNQNVNFSHLRSQLAEMTPTFDERATLEQNQASIKSLIELSVRLNSIYQSSLQQDYDARITTLNSSISSLNTLKDQLQKTVNNLNQKEQNYSNTLSRNVSSLTSAYTNRKNIARTTKESADQWQISTTEIQNLLNLQDLQAPENNVEKQIEFINEYTNRIINLYTETIQLQKKIIIKTENALTAKNNLTKKIQEQLNLANNEIQGKALTIKNLNDENQKYKKNLTEKSSLINSLQNQKQSIQKQLDDVNSKLKDAINNYTKYKNVILNSTLYQNATQNFVKSLASYQEDYKNVQTGYTGIDTKYWDDFKNYKWGYESVHTKRDQTPQEPNRVVVVNKISAIAKNPDKSKFTFRFYYIDTQEKDDAKKLKTMDISYTKEELLKYSRTWTKTFDEYSYGGEFGQWNQTEHFVTSLIDPKIGKFEFTNVIADSSGLQEGLDERIYEEPYLDPGKGQYLKSRMLLISVQELDD
ncbi:hypothetical protein NPA08_03175 [Mycoplasmopsis citelli]|uniref:hypothetical protein n=1 Tax=Mycoplasmopsis citelli TaxID=171281 RepID=UPI0021154E1B|nr:hypothetical protein [Mycoplasmopsis citelli]UUD35935.1 hypothetical protein NPA08_03175 [Mycoplasmopsis citelli]